MKNAHTDSGKEILFERLKSFSKFKGSKRMMGFTATSYMSDDDIIISPENEFLPDILSYSSSRIAILDDEKEANQAMYDIERHIISKCNMMAKEDHVDIMVVSLFNIAIMIGGGRIKYSVMFSIEGHRKNK